LKVVSFALLKINPNLVIANVFVMFETPTTERNEKLNKCFDDVLFKHFEIFS